MGVHNQLVSISTTMQQPLSYVLVKSSSENWPLRVALGWGGQAETKSVVSGSRRFPVITVLVGATMFGVGYFTPVLILSRKIRTRENFGAGEKKNIERNRIPDEELDLGQNLNW